MEYEQQKLLTIAVPCYNVEWCLEKCLSSLLCDGAERLQVLIISDGSTDRTSEIAQQFSEKHPHVFELIEKENGGHGSVINAAIALAKGKYFKVVDADDWVITENLALLLDMLAKTEADAIITQYHLVDMTTGNRQEFRIEYADLNRQYDADEYFALPVQAHDSMSFHGLTYKTECYRQSGLKLSEGIFYEDQEYATLPFTSVKTILPLDMFFYQYLLGNDNQSVSYKNQVKRIGDMEQVLDSLLGWYDAHLEMPEGTKRYFHRKITDHLLSYYAICLIKNPDRKGGRRLVGNVRSKFSGNRQPLFNQVKMRGMVIKLMHYLRFTPKMYYAVLHSRLYKAARSIVK